MNFDLPISSSRTLAVVLDEIADFAESVHNPDLHEHVQGGDGMNFCPGCAIKFRLRLVRKQFNIANLKHVNAKDYRSVNRV